MSKIPENIGKYMAQFQDMVDKGVEWGAKKLDEIEVPEKTNTTTPNTLPKKVSHIGKIFLKGVGRVGKSYYSEYETLKEEKHKKIGVDNHIQCHKDSILYKSNTNKLPVILEVPHGGKNIPEFMYPYIRDIDSVQKDIDWFTQEVYGDMQNDVNTYLQWNIARVLVDPNRKLNENIQNIQQDGVIKKCSMFATEVWRKTPPIEDLQTFLHSCVHPYYDLLKQSIGSSNTQCIVFGHSMPEQKTVSSTAIDKDIMYRPLISISNGNNHAVGISPQKLDAIHKILCLYISKFNLENVEHDTNTLVGKNYPYEGITSIERFDNLVYKNTTALLIEFNRGLGKHPENIEILKKMVREVVEYLGE